MEANLRRCAPTRRMWLASIATASVVSVVSGFWTIASAATLTRGPVLAAAMSKTNKFMLVIIIFGVLVLWCFCLIRAALLPRNRWDIIGAKRTAWMAFIVLLPLIGDIAFLAGPWRALVSGKTESSDEKAIFNSPGGEDWPEHLSADRPSPGNRTATATVDSDAPADDAHADASWEVDPHGRFDQRYWDGEQWTSHVADIDGNQSEDPAGA